MTFKNEIAAIQVKNELELKDKTIELSKIKNKQLWTYAILAAIAIVSLSPYFLNRYRIKQLRLKNVLQQREALQKEQQLAFHLFTYAFEKDENINLQPTFLQ